MSEIKTFKLELSDGSYLLLCNYGARIVSLVVPDKNGVLRDIIVGYSDINNYLDDDSYFGATVGRFANRIHNASFCIDGTRYDLEKNDGDNTNHSGVSGFSKQFWHGEYIGNKIVFSLSSPHLDGGYPGNVTVKVSYGFSEDKIVTIDYEAVTDRVGVLNLTNHSYFNLSGEAEIFNHALQIDSDRILETDKYFIPSGAYRDVEHTEFDFRKAIAISRQMKVKTQQLEWNKGYNHCYVISLEDDKSMRFAALLTSEMTGLQLEIYTTYPGLLIYTAGYLDSPLKGKPCENLSANAGICFEAQYFPDTPNNSHFPSCTIYPDTPYHHKTEFRIK